MGPSKTDLVPAGPSLYDRPKRIYYCAGEIVHATRIPGYRAAIPHRAMLHEARHYPEMVLLISLVDPGSICSGRSLEPVYLCSE